MPLDRVPTSETEPSTECSVEYSVRVPGAAGHDPRRSREVAVIRSRCCHCLPLSVRLTFTPESLERLYQSYFRRQREENLLVLVVFAALFNAFIIIMCAVVYTRDKLVMLLVAAAGLLADVALYLLCRFRKLPSSPVARGAVPYVLWMMVTIHVLCYMSLNYQRFSGASDSVGWQAFFSFTGFLTLPLNLLPLILLTALSCGVHTLVLGVTVAQTFQDHLQGAMLVRQVVKNIYKYLADIIIF